MNGKQKTCACQERGEQSRSNLIQAGLKIFSEVGFQSASTRRLASEAGVNIAAIPYYFGSKEGLYHAVLSFTVEFYRSQLGEEFRRIHKALADATTTREQLLDLLDEYMRMVVHFMLRESPERSQMSKIYLREQMDPTAGFSVLYEGFIREMRETHEALVAAVLGRDADSLEVKLLSQTMIGQVTIFKASRITALKHLKWREYSEENMTAVERVVTANVQVLVQAFQQKENEE